MIVAPDARAIDDIVLLEAWQRPVDGAVRPVYTEIDRVFLLCNACELGACEIDYWIRDGENITNGCQQCPQWKCDGDCVGEVVPKILLPPPPPATAIPPVPLWGINASANNNTLEWGINASANNKNILEWRIV